MLDKFVDENMLFARVAEIIENRKSRAGAYVNREITLMYWEIGQHINSIMLDGKRAEYGKKIFSTLSRKLVDQFGKSFHVARCKTFSSGKVEKRLEYFYGDSNEYDNDRDCNP